MTLTFDELARERNRDRVMGEAVAFADMLREALFGALDADDPGAAMRESLSQFETAMEEAIPAWTAGKTTLSKTSTLSRCRAVRDGIEKILRDAGEDVPETSITQKETRMEATEMLKTRAAVTAAIGVKAEEIEKRDNVSPGVARMKAWEELPHLRKRYEELPHEELQATEPARPLRPALQEATAQAQELMKRNPDRYQGISSARMDVYKVDPELAERVRREQEA